MNVGWWGWVGLGLTAGEQFLVGGVCECHGCRYDVFGC